MVSTFSVIYRIDIYTDFVLVYTDIGESLTTSLQVVRKSNVTQDEYEKSYNSVTKGSDIGKMDRRHFYTNLIR